jgi:hypothetical protein
MSDTVVNVSVPYVVEFIRRKCRTVESGIFWEDGTVAIRTVPAEQAPVACCVCPGENSSTPELSVRSFDGRLWWPLFDGPRPMSVRNYIASAAESDGVFLSMMNLSPATVYSSPRRNARQFFEHRVDAPLREERWRSAQRVAHRTLFCDDLVYLEGGCPVYFGVRRGTANDRILSIEVGSAAPDQGDAISRYLPGPRPKERRHAACRSLVYGMESIEEQVDALRRRGFQVTFGSRAELQAELRSGRDATEICGDALVRRAVAVMDLHSFRELGPQLQRQLKPAALLSKRISPALCRDAIYAMIAICKEDDFFRRFGLEYEWADETLIRLDAMHPPIDISELDERCLLAISN